VKLLVGCGADRRETAIQPPTSQLNTPLLFINSLIIQISLLLLSHVPKNKTDKVSLKIDPVAEKEQSKYWRFKHENFKKGRQDLLIEIKRHASNSNSSSNSGSTALNNGAGPTPNVVVSNSNMTMMTPPIATSTSSTSTTINTMPPPTHQHHQQQQKDVSRLNTEVKSLKKQMSSMAKNMEDLTSLVKGMNVSSSECEGGEDGLFDASAAANVGNKRKKISLSPEVVPSSSSFGGMVNEEDDVVMMSSFPSVDDALLEDSAAADLLLPDLTPSSSLLPSSSSSPVLSRSSSMNGVAAAAASGGGGDFVDELFHAFATEEEGQPSSQQQQQQQVVMMENPNKPDAALMKRIEDSLSTIPKTMHEMVANRLIDAIAEGNKDISACSSSSLSISPNAAVKKEDTPASADVVPEAAGTSSTSSSSSTIPLPLAVATLKTILADYGLKVESCGSNSEDAMVHRRMSNKSLPLVPMHA
jgi:hypothetical protein